MAIAVHVPTALRGYCDGADQLTLSAGTVRAALVQLEQSHPLLYSSVCDETGAVRRVMVTTSRVAVEQWRNETLQGVPPAVRATARLNVRIYGSRAQAQQAARTILD